MGFEDEKGALSVIGDYVLNDGSIDTTGLAPGQYVLTLTTKSAPNVLRSDVDLSADVSTNFMRQAESYSGSVSITFMIGEE